MSDPVHVKEDPPLRRGVVRVYAYYRFFLSALLLGMYLAGLANGIFGTLSAPLFATGAVIMFFVTAISLVWLIAVNFQCNRYFLLINLLIDIVGLYLLIFASHGLSSGLGLLLLVAIATGSLLFSGQLPLFLAAFSSILVIAGAVILIVLFDANTTTLFPAGLLGILLFATALLFRVLYRRMVEAESVATREADQAAHLQRLNELIVNRMRTGIVLIDVDEEIKLINHAATELLLGSHVVALDMTPASLGDFPELNRLHKRWQSHPWLQTSPINVAITNTDIQCNFAKLDQPEGQHTILFIEDVRSAAQNAQQLKLQSLGRLAGSVAHEIRNPLGAISHAAQLVAEHKDTPGSVKQLTDIIIRHTERVNATVDSIIDLSRQKAPDFQILDLVKWLKHYVKDYGNNHREAGVIQLHGVNRENPSADISFDPQHLAQVLSNLIENAHRYSKQETGEAWVKLSYHLDPLTQRSCLDIYDKGPGVDHQYVSQIFEPFFTTSPRGTGLGLYLAKERCEFNYASLTYHRDKGQGKGFFRIFFAPGQQQLPRQVNDDTNRAYS